MIDEESKISLHIRRFIPGTQQVKCVGDGNDVSVLDIPIENLPKCKELIATSYKKIFNMGSTMHGNAFMSSTNAGEFIPIGISTKEIEDMFECDVMVKTVDGEVKGDVFHANKLDDLLSSKLTKEYESLDRVIREKTINKILE